MGGLSEQHAIKRSYVDNRVGGGPLSLLDFNRFLQLLTRPALLTHHQLSDRGMDRVEITHRYTHRGSSVWCTPEPGLGVKHMDLDKTLLSEPGHVLVPVVPVGLLVGVVLWDVGVLALPGGLVVGQVPPLDQVVDVTLLVHAGGTRRPMENRLIWRRLISPDPGGISRNK